MTPSEQTRPSALELSKRPYVSEEEARRNPGLIGPRKYHSELLSAVKRELEETGQCSYLEEWIKTLEKLVQSSTYVAAINIVEQSVLRTVIEYHAAPANTNLVQMETEYVPFSGNDGHYPRRWEQLYDYRKDGSRMNRDAIQSLYWNLRLVYAETKNSYYASNAQTQDGAQQQVASLTEQLTQKEQELAELRRQLAEPTPTPDQQAQAELDTQRAELLQEADQAAANIKAAAQQEAQQIRQSAEKEAQRILNQANEQAQQLRQGAEAELEQQRTQMAEAAEADARRLREQYLIQQQRDLREALRQEETQAVEQQEAALVRQEQAHQEMCEVSSRMQAQLVQQLEQTVANINSIKQGLCQELNQWRTSLYLSEFKPLADAYLGLYKITNVDQLTRMVIAAAEQCPDGATEEVTALVKRVQRLEQSLTIFLRQLERAMGSFGLYVYFPKEGQPFDPYWHILSERQEDLASGAGNVVARCTVPGIGRKYAEALRDDECIRQAEVLVI
jgi:chemotaxis protein histidine kinase CheA